MCGAYVHKQGAEVKKEHKKVEILHVSSARALSSSGHHLLKGEGRPNQQLGSRQEEHGNGFGACGCGAAVLMARSSFQLSEGSWALLGIHAPAFHVQSY